MQSLLQRVNFASVMIEGKTHCAIGRGLLVFVAFTADDTDQSIQRMAQRVLSYRVFADASGRMNLSVTDVAAEVLVVSQFTLAANTRKGNRPSFAAAMSPERAKVCYDDFIADITSRYAKIAQGVFQADMQVSLCNDGPVTFILDT